MAPENTDRLLPLAAVVHATGFSAPTIYRKIAAGHFPRPAKIGRASRWSEVDIQNWIKVQKAVLATA